MAFQDETFFTHRKRVVAIAEEFLRRGLRFTWTATMRADQGARLSDEVFALCARSGLRQVIIGVESGSQEMLNWMTKDITLEQVLDCAEKRVRHNLAAIFPFIFVGGCPCTLPGVRVALQRVSEYDERVDGKPNKQQGGQDMAAIPTSHQDLFSFEKRAFAHLATLMPDGSPQVTPVWFDFDGTHILINSARGRQKDRNMRRDPRVAVEIMDPDNPYRYVQIRGQVVEITEEGADEHIDRLAKKYLGVDRYPHRRPGEVRVTYKILPVHVSVFG